MLWIVGPVSNDYRAYFAARGIMHGQFLPAGKSATAQQVIRLDFSSTGNLRRSLTDLTEAIDVSAVLVTGLETYVLPAAYIAAHFGVPGLSAEAALAATDKLVMRRKFMEYDPAISPAFTEVKNFDDARAFLSEQLGPVMLKPANLMKSLYITKNSTADELHKNYDRMLQDLPAVYREHRLGSPRILVESYMSGSMHTVAGFVDASGVLYPIPEVVDCTTARDIGRDDSYLFARNVPSRLTNETQAALMAATNAGVTALGLTSTAIHAELILTPDGPKLIEIAARIGGFRPRMYEQAYGIDMYRHAIDTAYGQTVSLQPGAAQASTVIELFPVREGIYRGVENIDALQQLATYVSIKIKAVVGELIGRASDGYRAAAIINLAGSADQIAPDVAFVRDKVTVLTKND